MEEATEQHAERLAALRNELLAQRANDVRDVGGRVLRISPALHKSRQLSGGSILIAEDLTPSDTATMEARACGWFCDPAGGATSHVAILARSLGFLPWPELNRAHWRWLTVPGHARRG